MDFVHLNTEAVMDFNHSMVEAIIDLNHSAVEAIMDSNHSTAEAINDFARSYTKCVWAKFDFDSLRFSCSVMYFIGKNTQYLRFSC